MASRRANLMPPSADARHPAPATLPRVATLGDQIGAAVLGRRVARSLRILRKERKLSLHQLATASGVSRATLWQIERSRTNPTLSLLWKITVGLGVPFHALLGYEPGGRPQVLREDTVPPMLNSSGTMQSRLLSPAGANQNLDVYELKFFPKGLHQSEPHGEGTTETLFVVSGALRVTVGGEVHDLSAGDSIFFHADLPHSYESRSPRETRCLDVIAYRRS